MNGLSLCRRSTNVIASFLYQPCEIQDLVRANERVLGTFVKVTVLRLYSPEKHGEPLGSAPGREVVACLYTVKTVQYKK
jgi:hypothetical protein